MVVHYKALNYHVPTPAYATTPSTRSHTSTRSQLPRQHELAIVGRLEEFGLTLLLRTLLSAPTPTFSLLTPIATFYSYVCTTHHYRSDSSRPSYFTTGHREALRRARIRAAPLPRFVCMLAASAASLPPHTTTLLFTTPLILPQAFARRFDEFVFEPRPGAVRLLELLNEYEVPYYD